MGYGDDQRGYDAIGAGAPPPIGGASHKRRRDHRPSLLAGGEHQQQHCMQDLLAAEQQQQQQHEGSEAIELAIGAAASAGGATGFDLIAGTAADANDATPSADAAAATPEPPPNKYALTEGVHEDMAAMREQLEGVNRALNELNAAVVARMQAMLNDWSDKLAGFREMVEANAERCAGALVAESDLTRRAEAQRVQLTAAVRALQACYERFDDASGY